MQLERLLDFEADFLHLRKMFSLELNGQAWEKHSLWMDRRAPLALCRQAHASKHHNRGVWRTVGAVPIHNGSFSPSVVSAPSACSGPTATSLPDLNPTGGRIPTYTHYFEISFTHGSPQRRRLPCGELLQEVTT